MTLNRDKVIQLRVTEEEQTRYKAAAASENLGLSEWIRKRCEGRTEAPVASQGHPDTKRGRQDVKAVQARLVDEAKTEQGNRRGRPTPGTDPGQLVQPRTEGSPDVAGSADVHNPPGMMVKGRERPTATAPCSRTGFPVEVCLCPQCKKLK